jgi:hypothetical protein
MTGPAEKIDADTVLLQPQFFLDDPLDAIHFGRCPRLHSKTLNCTRADDPEAASQNESDDGHR